MRWLFTTPAAIDHGKVVAAIQAAEQATTAEIRVVLARHRARHPLAAAQRHFHRLGMERAPGRNAVLIFVAPRSRNFAVIGDKVAHQRCGEAVWAAAAATLATRFKQGDFTAGLVETIGGLGLELARHFPRPPGGPENRFPDKIEEVD